MREGTVQGGHEPKAGSVLYGTYILALAASLIGNLLVRVGGRGGWLPGWGRVAVAIVAVGPLMAAAVVFWRLLRRDLDEMVQRIVLEGMAFALVAYVPLAALYMNLRSAGVGVPGLDAPDVLMTPALLVAVGIALAWRRYQ